MRRPHLLLLHVLLSLALVANGIGAAMASAHAGCVHSATAAALPVSGSSVLRSGPVVESPCHGDMGPETASAAASITSAGAHHSVSADISSADPASTDAHDSGDGCDSACGCDCTAHGQAALIPPALLLHASVRIAHARTFAYAYAAPALPHPVRPPIG